MQHSHQLLNAILNALPEHIVVIDQQGMIQYVNQSWRDFCCTNTAATEPDWYQINYLTECKKAAANGDPFGEQAAAGILRVIQQESNDFYIEYPCHSPTEKRWFMMRVRPITLDNQIYFVISHHSITERKLAEEKAEQLSRLDGLTGIANRRSFDEFLHNEWLRCTRLKMPLSLAMIDIDHFKQLNDHFGHQVGDQCLINIAQCLQTFARRPGDLCARYGGEEFAIVLANTDLQQAHTIIEKLHLALQSLAHTEINKADMKVTASIGLACTQPVSHQDETLLITQADTFLYQAKQTGRNKIVC